MSDLNLRKPVFESFQNQKPWEIHFIITSPDGQMFRKYRQHIPAHRLFWEILYNIYEILRDIKFQYNHVKETKKRKK